MNETYTTTYIQNKIAKSSLWVTRALVVLNEKKLIQPTDEEIVESMITFFHKFNRLSDKHVELMRNKINQRYIPALVELANK